MAEIDDVLRSALSRVPLDADTAGVADAIRARVAAGDTGTPARSSGFPAGPRGWLPFIGLIVVAAVIGASLGLSGLLGHPIVTVSKPASTTSAAPIPSATPTQTPAPTAAASTAPVAPVVPVAPAPPRKDTTPPTLVVNAPSADTIWGVGSSCSPTSTTIATTASNAGGVAGTTAVSSKTGTVIAPSGPPTATTFTVSVNDPGISGPETVTITVTARDAAGNATIRTTSFTLYSQGNCVF